MDKESRILVVSNNEFIGKIIFNKLKHHGYINLINTFNLNLNNNNDIKQLIYSTKPEYVFLTDIDTDIEQFILNILNTTKVKKIINFIKNNNPKPYIDSYNRLISIMIDEVYGDYDNYNYENCNILPEIMRKIHDGKVYNMPNIYIYINDNKKINFIYNDDLANAAISIISNNSNIIIDLKTGSNINIKCLTDLIKEQLDYNGDTNFIYTNEKNNNLNFNYKKNIKRLDWMSKLTLKQGVRKTYLNLIDENKYFYVTKFF